MNERSERITPTEQSEPLVGKEVNDVVNGESIYPNFGRDFSNCFTDEAYFHAILEGKSDKEKQSILFNIAALDFYKIKNYIQ